MLCLGLEVGLFVLIELGDKVFVFMYGWFVYLLGEICECVWVEVIYLEKDWFVLFE